MSGRVHAPCLSFSEDERAGTHAISVDGRLPGADDGRGRAPSNSLEARAREAAVKLLHKRIGWQRSLNRDEGFRFVVADRCRTV
jgi:hypothetical protein